MSVQNKKRHADARGKLSEKHKYRRGLLTVVAGVMTLCLFCLTLSIAVLVQFGVEGVALDNITDETYYGPQSETLEARVKKLTVDCGLPESIVEQVFDSEEILSFTKEYTRSRLQGFGGEPHGESVRERLRANLYKYMEDGGMDKARLDMDALNAYLSQAVSIYIQTLNNGFVMNYQQIRENAILPAAVGGMLSVLLIVLCVIYMYRVTGMRRKMLSYTVRALIAAAFICASLALWRFCFHGQTGITYSPEYMEVMCNSFENFFFFQFGIGAAVWAASAVCCGLGIVTIKSGKGRSIGK